MKLVSKSGKHVKKGTGALLAEVIQQKLKDQLETSEAQRKKQPTRTAQATEKTKAPEKRAVSYKAPEYRNPEESRASRPQGRHEAPPKKAAPKQSAEPKREYSGRHEAPQKKAAPTQSAEPRREYSGRHEAPQKKAAPTQSAEPRREYSGRHEAPQRKAAPAQSAEPRREYSGRHEAPQKKTAPEHDTQSDYSRREYAPFTEARKPESEFEFKTERAEYTPPEPERKAEPERKERWEYYEERAKREPETEENANAVDSADKFNMFNEEFYYDEWLPVGAKARIRKQQELQVKQKEDIQRKARNKDVDDDFGWDTVKPKKKTKSGKKKKRHPGRIIITIACILIIFVDMYFRFLYTDVGFIRNLRDAYIETAMSTMSHQWMAEWFFPQDIIDEVMGRVEKAQQDQEGIESDWNKKNEKVDEEQPDESAIETEEDFYELFWEIDKNTFKDYVTEHPEVIKNGWGEIYINEAGLSDNGTSIWTKMDEQVLAIDVPNRIILIRVQGSGYQGVLAVAKDSSRLSLCQAQNVGSVGEQLESIMTRTDAVLGMTGSGFIDEGGNGNGGTIVGFARCQGTDFGTRVGYPYKRTELREDNLLYVVDSGNEVSKKATDAVEFAPALVINGEALIDELSGYTSINPRACIGQTEKGELLMLVIEGRLPSRSFGTGLPECTEILMQHNAYQAMNLDGGTSAIMWYDGEYVTKCSNTNITCRTLPNAWIYARESLD